MRVWRWDLIWGSYIDNLHVVPERQRASIDPALMKAAAEWLDTATKIGVYLQVMATNYPRDERNHTKEDLWARFCAKLSLYMGGS